MYSFENPETNQMVAGGGVIHYPSIAPQYARVQWRKQGYALCDLQSPTGTYVNGLCISENLLKDGWIVRFGEVEFIFFEAHLQA